MTLKYRKQSSTGDYLFGGGEQDFLNDVNAVVQAINTKLLLLKAEWWEDVDIGLPLFQQILGATGSYSDLLKTTDLFVQEEILEVEQVTGIEEFESSYSEGTYSFSCTVNTVYGEATLEVDL